VINLGGGIILLLGPVGIDYRTNQIIERRFIFLFKDLLNILGVNPSPFMSMNRLG
jgi:hypothetical protein